MSVKTAVLIKQVPDTETKIQPKGNTIDEANVKYIISPYDEFAIEEAIKTRDKFKEGTVTVVTAGPDRVVEALRTAGLSEAEIVEVIAAIGLNIFTNYFNHIAATEVDFPLVRAAAPALTK